MAGPVRQLRRLGMKMDQARQNGNQGRIQRLQGRMQPLRQGLDNNQRRRFLTGRADDLKAQGLGGGGRIRSLRQRANALQEPVRNDGGLEGGPGTDMSAGGQPVDPGGLVAGAGQAGIDQNGERVTPSGSRGPNEFTNDNMAALFPEMRGIEPGDFSGSPLFQFQKDELNRALDSELAAQGLSGSGAAIEAKRRGMTDLMGRETERFRDIAQREADRAQLGADRFFNLTQAEANRAERGEQNQFNNMMQLINTGLSQSPFATGAGMAQWGAGQTIGHGNTMGGLQGNNYDRFVPGPAPTSGPSMPFIPPAPSGPDFTGSNIASGFANTAGSQDIFGSLNGLFANFF